MSILVPLFMLLTVVKANNHQRFAYVQRKLQQSCEKFPKTNFCPGLDIKVAVNTSSTSLDILKFVNSSLSGFMMFGVNESCINAVLKVKCLGFPRCNEEKGESAVDSSAALAECSKGQNMCPSIVRSLFLNCSALAEQYKQRTRSLNIGKCQTLKDTSGFCPEVKYKRFVPFWMNASSYFESIGQMKTSLELLKPKVSSECYENYKSFMCSSQEACSDDEKYVVMLISKQDCMERFKCLPPEAPGQGEACNDLPDAESKAVKKVPYPGEIKGPSGSASSLKTISISVAFSIILLVIALLI